jgi:hypothetical protein
MARGVRAYASRGVSPPPDPEASAQADAAPRRDFIDAGMPGAEVDALLGDLERLLQA